MLSKNYRTYKVGDRFTPKTENMFWEKYIISGIATNGGPNHKRGRFSYFVDCIPKDKENFSQATMVIQECIIDKTMDIMENQTTYKVKIEGEYTKGGIKVALKEHDPEMGIELPYATLSVWCKSTPDLQEDEFVLKNYSENRGMDHILLTHGVIELTDRFVQVGYEECPVVKLTDKREWDGDM